MKAKVTTGNNFRRLIDYLLGPEKGAEIIGGNVWGVSTAQIARQFRAIADLRPDVAKPVYHASMSAVPGEKLTAAQWDKVWQIHDAKQGMPDDGRPYIIVRHRDKDHDHTHKVYCRIGLDGSLWHDSHSALKAIAASGEAEKQLGLVRTKQLSRLAGKTRRQDKTRAKRGEQLRAERLGATAPREVIQGAIDAALAAPVSLDDFTAALGREGVTVRLNQASTGRISGISFAIKDAAGVEVAYKGSGLGKRYSWAALQKRGLDAQQEEDKDNEQKDQDNERAAAETVGDDARAAGRDSGADGRRDAGAFEAHEQRSRISITPGEKGLLTPRIIAAPPRPIEEQRAMEAAAQRNQDKPSRPQETAEERKRRLCSRAPREPEPTQPAPAQAAQVPAQEIEADAEEIARIIAEAEAWDRRMAQEPPPTDINEHCDRARQSAALHYRADKARRGIILPLESGEVQRAAQKAEEQAWETYVPHRSDEPQAAQDNNQDDNNPRLATWKRDLEAAGAPPPRKGRDRDDFSR